MNPERPEEKFSFHDELRRLKDSLSPYSSEEEMIGVLEIYLQRTMGKLNEERILEGDPLCG